MPEEKNKIANAPRKARPASPRASGPQSARKRTRSRNTTPSAPPAPSSSDTDQHFRVLFDHNLDAVFLTIPDGRIVAANPAACALFGMSEQELCRLGRDGLIDPEDPRHQAAIEERRRTGCLTRAELRYVRKNGQRFTAEADSVILSQDPPRSFVILRDITDRKRAEEALRQSDQRYRLLAETMLQGVVHQDAQGTIIAMNPAAETILGKTRQDFLGSSSVQEEPHTVREDGSPFPGMDHPAMVALRTGQPVRGVVMGVFNPKLHQRRWISIDAVPVFRSDPSHPHEVYTVFTDITARKQAELDLARERAALALKNSQLQAMFEHSNAGLVLFEAAPPHRILAVNRFYEQLWPEPWPSRGLVGLCLTDFAPGLVEAGVAEVFREVVRSGKGCFIPNTPYDHMVGGRRWWNWTLEPVIQDGKVVALAHLAVEVTAEVKARELLQDSLRQRQQAEEALRQSEERFRVAQELSPDGFLLFRPLRDHAGVVTDFLWLYQNAAAARMNDTHPQEVCGKRVSDVLPHHDQSPFHQAYKEVAETGQVRVVEEAFYEQDTFRQRRWFRAVAVPTTGGDVAILVQNVTERKQAEAALQASEAKFRSVLENSLDAAYRRNLRTDSYDYLSPVMEQVLGISLEAMRHLPLNQLVERIHPEDRHRALTAIAEGMRLRSGRVEYRFLGDDAQYRWVADYFTVQTDEAGVPIARGGIVRDVREQKRAEEALRHALQRLATALDAADMGTWCYTLADNLCDYSERAQALYGLSSARFLHDEQGCRALLHPDDLPAMWSAVSAATDPAGTGRYSVQYRVRRPEGGWRWLDVWGLVEFEGEGPGRKPVQILGASRDITARKEFQAELERLVAERTAKLQEMVAELEHMSYSIIHDLRAPLRAMAGFAEMLAESCAACPQPDTHRYLQKIQTAAVRMDSLILDTLNYNRAVRQELPLESIDIEALLRGMLDTYPEFQVAKARIEIQGHLPPVLANQAGLTQCLSNLLNNAIKFTKPGHPPTIRIWAQVVESGNFIVDRPTVLKRSDHQPSTINHQLIRVFVEDDGIGIRQSMLPRVFDMFSRGHSTYEGTGIGLALVRKVMDRMGGQVGVQSQEGQGSRFWLDLQPAPILHF